MRILITGANGFIGNAICQSFLTQGFSVRAIARNQTVGNLSETDRLEWIPMGDLNSSTDWSNALKDIDIVIHTAARAHKMQDNAEDPLQSYRDMNTQVTLNLFAAAIQAQIKKFIFLSSIKVNGEETKSKPFAENDVVGTIDAYGLSKWEAEQGIANLAQSTSMNYTILRLPLVYGKGVKANFANLIKLVKTALPLPLGAIHNKRSFIYIGNLISAINAIMSSEKSAQKTYLLSDNEDLSTPELIRLIARSYNAKLFLPQIPLCFLRVLAFLTGKKAFLGRLTSSLQVDSGKIRGDLNWKPPYSVEMGLAEMVKLESEETINTIRD
jgi:nucleoside-diphosphate-sugar epimerase